MNNYELMRMFHFAQKLKRMLENGKREQLNECAPEYVRLPLHETQDAIEEIEKHINELIIEHTSNTIIEGRRETEKYTKVNEDDSQNM